MARKANDKTIILFGTPEQIGALIADGVVPPVMHVVNLSALVRELAVNVAALRNYSAQQAAAMVKKWAAGENE